MSRMSAQHSGIEDLIKALYSYVGRGIYSLNILNSTRDHGIVLRDTTNPRFGRAIDWAKHL